MTAVSRLQKRYGFLVIGVAALGLTGPSLQAQTGAAPTTPSGESTANASFLRKIKPLKESIEASSG
jgi:hypothetical protein